MVIGRIEAIFLDLGDTLVRSVPGQARTEWIEGAREGLAALSLQDVRLGLLSNTGDLSREQLFRDRLPEDFPRDAFTENLMILSSEVGVAKPKPQIFALAIDAAGVPPGACLFCTEELDHVLAAQQIGMRSIWVPPGSIGPLVARLIERQILAGR